MYYTSQSYVQQIDSGEDYNKLCPVYFIGILDFNADAEVHYFNTHEIINTKTNSKLFKDLQINIIEL